MRRTEDEFRKDFWVDVIMLACYIFLGATLIGVAIKGL